MSGIVSCITFERILLLISKVKESKKKNREKKRYKMITRNCPYEVKETLELFHEQKTKGIIIRARARWHEHGERSSKYFLTLKKRNRVKKNI